MKGQMYLTGGVSIVTEHLTAVEAATTHFEAEPLAYFAKLLAAARKYVEAHADELNTYDNMGMDVVKAFRFPKPKVHPDEKRLYDALRRTGWIEQTTVGLNLYIALRIPEPS